MNAKRIIHGLLKEADVTVGGDAPQDMHVHNEALYARVLRGGSLALGESYMDGWWDANELDAFFTHILLADLPSKVKGNAKLIAQIGTNVILNPQRKKKAFEIGEHHYDVGNDLYEKMLDKSMTYTCGYWKDAKTLDEAQFAKLDLVCKKIGLQKGQRVLDIGCGWGSFGIHAAKHYGASVVGVTVSKEQIALGMKRAKGLDVELKFQDYRDVEGEFDHIVSLGMFEHVGVKNYRDFMQLVSDHLKDDGLFLLHTIGRNMSSKFSDPWIAKYIFPNSLLPSISQIGQSTERLFVMEDWHNFGAYYDNTLMGWHQNIEENWDTLKDTYNERFHRMWTYYLLSCAGAFRSRNTQLWQIVLSKKGVVGGHTSVR